MTTDVVYTIDANDLLSSVNDAWNAFALENGAPQMLAARVLETPLWRHVTDERLRQLLAKLVVKARTTRRPLVLSYRCDAPDERRTFEMTVASRDGTAVEFTHRLVKAERRAPVVAESEAPREAIVSCSWCNAVEAHGVWVEIETAVEALGLLRGPYAIDVRHGLCPPCIARLAQAAA